MTDVHIKDTTGFCSISLLVNSELPHHVLSPFLPLSDKLAFPVISALGIVVCSVRQYSLYTADRTRTVSLCLIVPVSGVCEGGGVLPFLLYCLFKS